MEDIENQPLSNGVPYGSNGDAVESKAPKSHKEHKHKKEKKEKKEKKAKKHKDKDKEHKHKHKNKDKDKEKKESSTHVKHEPTTPIKDAPAAVKREAPSSDDVPLAKQRRRQSTASDKDEDYSPLKSEKNIKTEPKAAAKRKSTPAKAPAGKKAKSEPTASPEKKKTRKELNKEQEQKDVWRWWEEERKDDGQKWKTLEHNGPVFAADYVPLPDHIKFKYDGKHVKLSSEAEEIAGFYGRMLSHDYCTMDTFNENFMKDWRKSMTAKERDLIKDLKKCDFGAIHRYFQEQSELRKARSKEEKNTEKEKNEELVQHYGYCLIDGHREKIGNFRIEPPSLFRGRGQHPKMGMLKRRVQPEDVIINCSKGSNVPKPPAGHKWKEVRHDNQVTWLASWTENVQNQTKYVMLNPASRLKGEKDWMKYEKARKLHQIVDRVRENYQNNFKSKEMRLRQRAVAIYFIDKLALRAGNEKDADEQADTVGCCSLRYEHITLSDEKDGKECVVDFDFLGKDSIRYQNSVAVEKRVYKNLKLFMENKSPGDDLFDRLNTTILNEHLRTIMDGLTAKVFRTYNASITLEQQLNLLTDSNDNVATKMLSYNRANRAVAVLCNHQRAVPKNFSEQMNRIQEKIKNKKDDLAEAAKALKNAKVDLKHSKSASDRANVEKKQKAHDRLKEQLHKLEVQATDKDENKDIALGTSKLNYLDPRISVAWCKKHDVPIEKVYNKTQRQKFMWAIDMAGPDFSFAEDD